MAKPAFIPIPTFVKDCTGQRFGRLVVLGLIRMETRGSGARSKRVPVFLAQCDCGNTKEAFSRNMKGGITHSCGCLQKEARVQSGKSTATHRMTKTPEYMAWRSMKTRCYRPANRNFIQYGGRGITVCDAWRDSFAAFYADLGPRPSSRHSLDRIDCNGHYEPGNCRWTTIDIQNTNRNSTVFVDYEGESISLAEAARRLGMSRSAFGDRHRAGLRGDELFAKPRYAV